MTQDNTQLNQPAEAEEVSGNSAPSGVGAGVWAALSGWVFHSYILVVRSDPVRNSIPRPLRQLSQCQCSK